MSVQIPPEPPDAAFVVIKRKRSTGRAIVVDAYQRLDDLTLGPNRWASLTKDNEIDWRTLWLENNRPGLYIYVATEFIDLYRYNRMEYPQ